MPSQTEAIKAIALLLMILIGIGLIIGMIAWAAWTIYPHQPVLAVIVAIVELPPLFIIVAIMRLFTRHPLAILEAVAKGVESAGAKDHDPDIGTEDRYGPGYDPETDVQIVPRIQLVPVHNWTETEATEDVVDAAGVSAASPWLTNFELSAADLAAFISQAGSSGLARSTWLTQPRRRLPSGRIVTRAVYDRVTAEMEILGWAERTTTGWKLRQPPRAILRQLEEATHEESY
ncbi:MAG TPA: hypothetical protein EYP14_16060 [Planctomycetaceae bacterium]|nr:hypothetical protein [Planctomycetaceae bacterium]